MTRDFISCSRTERGWALWERPKKSDKNREEEREDYRRWRERAHLNGTVNKIDLVYMERSCGHFVLARRKKSLEWKVSEQIFVLYFPALFRPISRNRPDHPLTWSARTGHDEPNRTLRKHLADQSRSAVICSRCFSTFVGVSLPGPPSPCLHMKNLHPEEDPRI